MQAEAVSSLLFAINRPCCIGWGGTAQLLQRKGSLG